jgi:hypothetical protein
LTLERNPNHAEEGVLKFAAPFWGKPRWAALFVAIARQIQELENVFWDILEKRMLDNATGAQLAVLGRLVGQLDPGLGEEVFRTLIRVRIRINRSNGGWNDLINVLQLLGIPKEARKLTTVGSAFRLDLYETPPLPLQVLHSNVSDALAAGVGLHVVYPGNGFMYSDNTATVSANAHAWPDQATQGTGWAGAVGPSLEIN